MTLKNREEFTSYLRNCTDAQVRGVLAKERAAGRADYAVLAKAEMSARGLS
jgi:hypothetical protein